MTATASSPRRLAFLLPNLGGGGAERIALNVIRELLDRGHEVDLVLARREGELLDLVPQRVTIVDLRAKRLMAAIRPLAGYLRRRRPHAVQARMWPLTVVAVLARMIARTSTRLILSDHAALSQQYGHSRRTMAMLRITTRLFYPRAEARIVVSSGAADDLAALSGLPRSSFETVYNPVPPLENSNVTPEAEAAWGSGGARIISVGTLKEQKNHKLLVRAFARLRRRRPARLLILGDGPLRGEIEALAVQEGVAEDVRLPGFLPEPLPYVAASDLFVLSSDYEGFGNVLIEAMRVGVSIVSTDCPSGPAEIVGQGRFGRLAPCGDAEALAAAMEEALDEPHDPSLLRERAEEISGARVMQRYFELMLDEGLASR